MKVVPITIKAARRWIQEHHSYLAAPRACLLAVSVETEGVCRCVATAEIPKARLMMNGTTAEISRVASDGSTPNAAGMAAGALVRALSALGYRRFVSATLLGERGTMYRALGWWPTAIMKGGEWSRESRPRAAAEQAGAKIRWEFGPDADPRSQDAESTLLAAIGTPRAEKQTRLGPLFDRC